MLARWVPKLSGTILSRRRSSRAFDRLEAFTASDFGEVAANKRIEDAEKDRFAESEVTNQRGREDPLSAFDEDD